MRISDWSSDVCSSDLFALRRQQDRFDAFDEFCGIHYAIAPQSGSGVECVGGGCADDGRCARRITEAAVDCWLAHAKVDVALLSPGGSRSNNVITAENRARWCRSESCLRPSLCLIPCPPQQSPPMHSHFMTRPTCRANGHAPRRSEEHTSELQSLMRISYAVFCFKKNNNKNHTCQKYNN